MKYGCRGALNYYSFKNDNIIKNNTEDFFRRATRKRLNCTWLLEMGGENQIGNMEKLWIGAFLFFCF